MKSSLLVLACMLLASTQATTAQPAAPSAGAVQPASQIPDIVVPRADAQTSAKGPAQNFTGSVRVDRIFKAEEPVRAASAYVTFEPGARTAWHTHPAGQMLIVTAGVGRVQRWGGPVTVIRAGDVVWIPPGVKHWHGAGSTTGMTHIAVTDQVRGSTTDWMEPVSDDQYVK